MDCLKSLSTAKAERGSGIGKCKCRRPLRVETKVSNQAFD